MSYSCEHDAAKKSFNEVTQLLDKVAKLDKESHVIDYIARVEADILLEKEANTQKLAAYYQNLVDEVRARRVSSRPEDKQGIGERTGGNQEKAG